MLSLLLQQEPSHYLGSEAAALSHYTDKEQEWREISSKSIL